MLDTIEQITRIFSLVALPLILGGVGYYIQAAISRRTVAKEYVQLAVSILADPKTSSNKPLREWAVDLLSRYSPVDLPSDLTKELGIGTTSLPALTWTVGTHPGTYYRAGTAIVRAWPPSSWAWSGGGDFPEDMGKARVKKAGRSRHGEDYLRVDAELEGTKYTAVFRVPDEEYRKRLLRVLEENIERTIDEIDKIEIL